MFKNKIICPYCGVHNDGLEYVLGVEGEYGLYYDTEEIRLCCKCSKKFKVEMMVVPRYKTEKTS